MYNSPNVVTFFFKVLPKNRRITVNEEGKFVFKPPYKVKGRNSLLNVLKRHDLEGKGGILLSDLNECIVNADKEIQVSALLLFEDCSRFFLRTLIHHFMLSLTLSSR